MAVCRQGFARARSALNPCTKKRQALTGEITMLNCFKRRTGLLAAAVLILLAGTAHADPQDENIVCTQLSEQPFYFAGLYKTDGIVGVTVISFVAYEPLPDGQTHVCKIGMRFPDPSRLTHCTVTGVCTAGEQLNVDLMIPGNVKGLTFKSAGFQLIDTGHEGGNYRDYRAFWDACYLAGTCTAATYTTSFSHDRRHVDIAFFHESAAYIASQLGFTGVPPAEIAAKCASEPDKPYAASSVHYSQGDCQRLVGRHWAEDKFETSDTFLNQPALKFVTFDGVPWGVMVGATPTVIDWVDANAQNDEATISFPQPEAFARGGETFPSRYFMRIVPPAQQIDGGATVEIGLTDFRAVNPGHRRY